jgi:hypothetical protein
VIIVVNTVTHTHLRQGLLDIIHNLEQACGGTAKRNFWIKPHHQTKLFSKHHETKVEWNAPVTLSRLWELVPQQFNTIWSDKRITSKICLMPSMKIHMDSHLPRKHTIHSALC